MRDIATVLLCTALVGCNTSYCKKACEKLAECQGLDPDDAWECPVEDCSSRLLRCQAKCVVDASCDALTGKDVGELAKCQARCNEDEQNPKPDQGVTNDGRSISDLWQYDTIERDGPVKRDGPVEPDTSGPCNCGARQCGDDGCGNSCGSCTAPEVCNFNSGKCITACYPDCDGRECGDDGCGGSCGTCDQCVDGQCHRTLGAVCDLTQTCSDGFVCVATASNADKGFCTEICSAEGDICSGAQSGMFAVCLFELNADYYCGFVCTYEGNSYNCPQGRTCDSSSGVCI